MCSFTVPFQTSKLPTPLHEHDDKTDGSDNKRDDQLRIAWRYQNLPKEHEKPSIFGNTFVFNHRLKVDDADITVFRSDWNSAGIGNFPDVWILVAVVQSCQLFNICDPVQGKGPYWEKLIFVFRLFRDSELLLFEMQLFPGLSSKIT